MEKEQLIQAALEARQHAYAPYSEFKVGAALLTKDGKVYRGCNIENASYTPTICAERNAFFKAVYEGERNFTAIAIAGGKASGDETAVGKADSCSGYAAPCGVCRQVMMEFCDPKSFQIIVARSAKDYVEYTLEELLPMGFGPGSLKE